jgi:transmembrane sensor
LILDLLDEIAEDPDMVKLSEATTAAVRERQSRQRPSHQQTSHQRPSHHLFRRTRRIITPIAATLVLGVFLWYLTPSMRPIKAPYRVDVYSTAAGEQRRIALNDGSQVELNTATEIRAKFTERARTLTLVRGEALFFVKHDTKRPFEVHAGATSTRAVGTTFDVSYLRDRANVAVLEGHVRVEASRATLPAQVLDLHAGQATTYAARDGLSPAQSADLSRISSWQARRVEFRDITLADAVDEFNRYATTQIRISDPALNDLRVSGVFRFDDTTAFTKALHATFGIEAEAHGGDIALTLGHLPKISR